MYEKSQVEKSGCIWKLNLAVCGGCSNKGREAQNEPREMALGRPCTSGVSVRVG